MVQIKADQAHQITDGDRSVVVGVLDSGIDPDHPDLAANIDVADSVSCVGAGVPTRAPVRGTPPPPTTAPTWPARSPPPATGSASSASPRASGWRRSRSSTTTASSTRSTRSAASSGPAAQDGRHQQQLLHRPDGVLVRRPARPGCGPHGRRAGRDLVDEAWRRPRRRGRQLRQGPGQQDDRLGQPQRHDADPAPDQQRVQGHPDRAARRRHRRRPPTQAIALASFSNRGRNVIDVAAPGRTILSTVVGNNGYGTKSGTSMASPHVAGVLALMKSAHPLWSPAKMISSCARRPRTTSAHRPRAMPDRHASGRSATTATTARASSTPWQQCADRPRKSDDGRPRPDSGPRPRLRICC